MRGQAGGRTALEALAADPGRAGLVLDFDGVLAPIVADPTTSALPDRVAGSLAAAGRRGWGWSRSSRAGRWGF